MAYAFTNIIEPQLMCSIGVDLSSLLQTIHLGHRFSIQLCREI